MKTSKKILVVISILCLISMLTISVASAEINQRTKIGLTSVSPQSTERDTFYHDFSNNYTKKPFFGGILLGTFNRSVGLGNATAKTEISMAVGMDGFSAVTLVGIDGKSYKNSQFGSNVTLLPSGNANAGRQPCSATSHNASRTIRNSGQYYGYEAKSSRF